MNPLFVYGSLMHENLYHRVIQVLLGLRVSPRRRIPATIQGYKRVKVRNAPYPGNLINQAVIPGQGQVDGIIVFLEHPNELEVLDQFETDMYVRTMVSVIVKEEWGDRVVQAQTYIWNKDHSLLLDEPWDYEDFLTNGLPGWMNKSDKEFIDAV